MLERPQPSFPSLTNNEKNLSLYSCTQHVDGFLFHERLPSVFSLSLLGRENSRSSGSDLWGRSCWGGGVVQTTNGVDVGGASRSARTGTPTTINLLGTITVMDAFGEKLWPRCRNNRSSTSAIFFSCPFFSFSAVRQKLFRNEPKQKTGENERHQSCGKLHDVRLDRQLLFSTDLSIPFIVSKFRRLFKGVTCFRRPKIEWFSDFFLQGRIRRKFFILEDILLVLWTTPGNFFEAFEQ